MKTKVVEEEAAFREFPGVKATFLSDSVHFKSSIGDQTENWGCQLTHMDLNKESLFRVFKDTSCNLLIIDDSEDLKVMNTEMMKKDNANLPYLRLLANNQKPKSNWQGDGLVLHKPLKPSELNSCFSKLLKNEGPFIRKILFRNRTTMRISKGFCKAISLRYSHCLRQHY